MPPNDRVANSTKRWNITPLQVGFGLFDRWSVIDKFGKNIDIDAAFEDVWTVGGDIAFLTSAEIMEVTSDDVGDTSAGLGAQSIHVFGLDSGFNEIDEVVITNGLTIVETTKSYIRVQRCHVEDVGASDSNIGTISVTAKVAGSINSLILPDEGQSQQAIFTIPATHTGFLETAFIAVDTQNLITAQILIRERNDADTAYKGWRVYHEVLLTQDHISFNMAGSEELPPKTDVRWRAKGNNPNNSVSAGFKILLYQD